MFLPAKSEFVNKIVLKEEERYWVKFYILVMLMHNFAFLHMGVVKIFNFN